ncbi:aminotransferase class V-fold PLP-dependent enzyme [Pengzhenrongella sicca]|uniref:Aminotransferase class V-fold PLP-dependent enzyme n=1 Tax=Pengzhenrongella sicca TaxID=2819238 RepID=A0A8A4ZAA6_9MICO|nr:aminotransferase class V-fold PLP-dependent enzyme [Pengzhenrongella sicca]QTE28385.1 aminotransferase class V-fold PLP-dependent enzyme [Pengzhenrongella sicca]
MTSDSSPTPSRGDDPGVRQNTAVRVPHGAAGRTVLDVAGHAPLHPAARAAFAQALDEGWADPRRLHAEGRRARSLLDGARASLAAGLGARTEEVFLAGSHTAALHAAVRGIARGRRRVGRDVVVGAVERAALLEAARFAAAEPAGAGAGPGRRVVVGVDGAGRVDAAAMGRALAAPGVALVALQHANGEVGTLQPVSEVAEAARRAGVPLLLDAGASAGHVELGPQWDALAADPGDWGGPSGLGVLAVRPRVRWAADWPEDDDAWFPGGVSVPAALAAAVALEHAVAERAGADAHRRRLVDRIRRTVAATVPDVEVVGDAAARLPHVVTFSCLYVDGEALVGELDRLGFAVGSGSACTSSTLEPSHVLAAMGVLTHGNVRLALPVGATDDGVDRFLAALPGAVRRVRDLLGVTGL